ncbi:hypothetical protein L9F63_025326, partial [Diploptera punctata]
ADIYICRCPSKVGTRRRGWGPNTINFGDCPNAGLKGEISGNERKFDITLAPINKFSLAIVDDTNPLRTYAINCNGAAFEHAVYVGIQVWIKYFIHVSSSYVLSNFWELHIFNL